MLEDTADVVNTVFTQDCEYLFSALAVRIVIIEFEQIFQLFLQSLIIQPNQFQLIVILQRMSTYYDSVLGTGNAEYTFFMKTIDADVTE